MILVDTSVWIDHFRSSEPQLVQWIAREIVLTHPFVIGEVSLGNFRRRSSVVEWFQDLARVDKAEDDEVLELIEAQQLYGTGIGFVDCHLLASLRLTRGTRLWARDKRLKAAAETIGVVVIDETQH
jgi:predicted nucleic acid-binding protein